ncbi:MAG: PBP1A family penicillin-binding protein [Candidatus Andersenbacteria bacterium]
MFRRGFAIVSLLLIISALVPATIVSLETYYQFRQHLASKEHITSLSTTGVVLLDRYGQPFFTLYPGQRKNYLPLHEIPLSLQQAVIAMEDQSFYHHPGFSIRGIIRSIFLNIQHQTFAYGGSTITQQVVKNSLLSPQKSLKRKYQELVLSVELERRYTKDDILEMYLNTAYFGEGAVGVENAARTYFAKPAHALTLAESSLLAALLPAPSSLSPLSGHIKKAEQRQERVLQTMTSLGFVSAAEQQSAQETALQFNDKPKPATLYAPHFALMVKRELLDTYTEDELARSGFTVQTTLDLAWQQYAETTVANRVEDMKQQKATNAAAVVLDPTTGNIRALIGSRDWHADKFGKVNMATRPRQTGSSFKPIVYATAFEEQIITPATVLTDQPTTFGRDYRPQNYDQKFRGKVLARRALANSLNVPTVEVMTKTGVASVIEQAQNLGITTLPEKNDYNLALALGAGEVSLVEMTSAYGAFAHAGQRYQPLIVTEVRDKFHQPVYRATPQYQQVLSAASAFMISSILSDVTARREVFGSALSLSQPAAVKTGTTENYRDAWTIGYTPNLVVGVWVGNNDNTPMHKVAGALGAAPIWRDLMEEFLSDIPIATFTPPASLVTQPVCRHNGLALAYTSRRAGYLEYFVSGTQPTKRCTWIRPTPSPPVAPSPNDPPHVVKDESESNDEDEDKDSTEKRKEAAARLDKKNKSRQQS